MLLLLLFGMALAWFLQKKLYQKNWQKNLKIQVSFQDSAIYEGEESTLKEVVVNDKLLPIPALELGISMSRNLEFDREAKANASITDQSYKRDVFSFLFHQQITRTLSFQAKKRGFYEITGAHAVAYDLFFPGGSLQRLPAADTDVRLPAPGRYCTDSDDLPCRVGHGSVTESPVRGPV